MSQHHQHLYRQQASSAPPSYPFPSHSSPYLHSPTSVPISPPHTRSASAETSSAALVEDFRAYTQKLRDQYEGERAHIVADRARGMEVMAEERALWDKERGMLLARIRELEARLQGVGDQPVPAQQQRARSPHRAPPSPGTRKTTPPSELPHPHPDVKQESGRNADGSPFYAPAPQNPTRTFSTEAETEALRVDDIVAPRETPLLVTSKELSASDFIRWAEGDEEEKESDIIGADSIDISHIAPHLEGVPIKASALDPVFVARVLSPQCSSPAKLSPNIRPPGRDVAAKKTQATLLGEAEIRRLTMYAGHTPNHSISRFADLVKDAGVDSERGDETPRGPETMPNSHRPSLAVPSNGVLEEEEDDTVADQDGDPALKGPLGLTNKSSKDNLFLEVLTEKLQEVEKEISEKGSPNLEMELDTDSMASWSPMLEMKSASKDQGGKRGEGKGEGDADGMPPLKLKPSMNFGRPMGIGF
ncbi:tho complex subunit 7 domain-containing protein [Rutstroemia sp. NJR-2017a BBW]|nr:tho complex subunit 7 domain-containing protein [Rutstroemia sp. NJR-2017a BBW]